VTALSALVLLSAGTAEAFHTNEQRLIDGTAYTLGKEDDWKVGLWTADYAALKRVDISTYILPWLLRVANIGARYEYRVNDRWSFGTGLHVFRLDFQKLNPDAPPLVISSVPWTLAGSYRFDPYTVSVQSVYTYMKLSGTLDEEKLEGAVAISNLQFVTTLEKRVSQVTALLLRFRFLAYQWDPSASAKFVTHPDEYTTVTIIGAASADYDIKNAWSLVPGVAWSWKYFNLRVGLGYGNLNIGGVNFVLPKKTIVPELDLAWRW